MALTGDLSDRNPVKVLRPRSWRLWLTFFAFLLLAIRLYALQIIRGESWH